MLNVYELKVKRWIYGLNYCANPLARNLNILRRAAQLSYQDVAADTSIHVLRLFALEWYGDLAPVYFPAVNWNISAMPERLCTLYRVPKAEQKLIGTSFFFLLSPSMEGKFYIPRPSWEEAGRGVRPFVGAHHGEEILGI